MLNNKSFFIQRQCMYCWLFTFRNRKIAWDWNWGLKKTHQGWKISLLCSEVTSVKTWITRGNWMVPMQFGSWKHLQSLILIQASKWVQFQRVVRLPDWIWCNPFNKYCKINTGQLKGSRQILIAVSLLWWFSTINNCSLRMTS